LKKRRKEKNHKKKKRRKKRCPPSIWGNKNKGGEGLGGVGGGLF
jgi:hypothetical protein